MRFADGPRGVIMDGGTTFPVSMGRGATFDPELEERVGDVIGRELRAMGGNFFGGVCINLLRHPARGVALSEDGQLVASGSFDGTVRLWEVGSGTFLRTLRRDRPYERMDITGLTGITPAQRASLLALGAVEEESSSPDEMAQR